MGVIKQLSTKFQLNNTTTNITMKSLLMVCTIAALSRAVPLHSSGHHGSGHSLGHHSLGSQSHHGLDSKLHLAEKLIHHDTEDHHDLESKLHHASKLHHEDHHGSSHKKCKTVYETHHKKECETHYKKKCVTEYEIEHEE